MENGIKKEETSKITQLACARQGIVTDIMRVVARKEYQTPELIMQEVAAGRLIIPANSGHTRLDPVGIGAVATCKINANIGASQVVSRKKIELEKLHIAIKAGADAVMDLSTGPNIVEIRQAIIDESAVPLGTVPIYEAVARARTIEALTSEIMFEVIEEQARQGVDFMTIHCGVLREYVCLAEKRVTGIVSRGGALMAKWMCVHNKENPFYTKFDRLLAICKKYDVSLSLGDGFRPGSLADASDAAQFAELKTLGELVLMAWKEDVQVMVEGPGHIPFDQIKMNMEKEKKLCHGAPFYVLGPIVIDSAPGYDHITSAIGGTMAAFCGASMLCYVTPREHLGLPSTDDVRQGVIASKIAAHAADVALGKPHAQDRDNAISHARIGFKWKEQFSHALDPAQAEMMYHEQMGCDYNEKDDYCSMCGPEFCPMRIGKQIGEQPSSGDVSHS